MSASIDRILLAYPSELLNLAESGSGNRSWIQLAKTGSFNSRKYGPFDITRQDLRDMVRNFKNAHPISPTQLPVDYDHLSMDPKKPGDGVAAGWIQNVSLRNGGDELWGEVDWTDPGAARVRAKEYRFISPSFMKNYVTKSGKEVGTTLLAAAVTNHPFLEGMQAIMLSDKPDPFFKKKAADDEDGADVADRVGDAKDDDEDIEVDGTEEMADDGDQRLAAVEEAVAKIAPGLKSRVLDISDTETGSIATWRQGDQTFRAQFQSGEGGAVTLGTPEPVTVTISPVAAANTPPQPAPTAPPAPAAPAVPPGQPVTAKHLSDKGEPTMSKLFKLNDNEGKEVTVSEDVLKAAIAQLNPADADAQAKIVNLSAQVEALATTLAAREQAAREFKLNASLDTIVRAGRITKAQRDWAFNLFSKDETTERFDQWVATVPTEPIIKLNHNHGAGGDTPSEPAGKVSANKLVDRAKAIQAEKRIDLRDALIQASGEMPEESERYREQFDPYVLHGAQ